jgi:hypothetical protein
MSALKKRADVLLVRERSYVVRERSHLMGERCHLMGERSHLCLWGIIAWDPEHGIRKALLISLN